MAAAGFVFGSEMISRVFHLFQMSHDADQTALGIERPKTGMFTFDKSTGKNSLVVSGAAHTHAHTRKHTQIRTLQVPRFKPCPLEGVKRGVSTTDELRKTGLFEITPTERMHTCVNTTQADTKRFPEVNVYVYLRHSSGQVQLSQV